MLRLGIEEDSRVPGNTCRHPVELWATWSRIRLYFFSRLQICLSDNQGATRVPSFEVLWRYYIFDYWRAG